MGGWPAAQRSQTQQVLATMDAVTADVPVTPEMATNQASESPVRWLASHSMCTAIPCLELRYLLVSNRHGEPADQQLTFVLL